MEHTALVKGDNEPEKEEKGQDLDPDEVVPVAVTFFYDRPRSLPLKTFVYTPLP
jgi:hypothetical protein